MDEGFDGLCAGRAEREHAESSGEDDESMSGEENEPSSEEDDENEAQTQVSIGPHVQVGGIRLAATLGGIRTCHPKCKFRPLPGVRIHLLQTTFMSLPPFASSDPFVPYLWC